MKRTIKSLAVLAIMAAAATFTSCNKTDFEPTLSSTDNNVVTIKIAPPSVSKITMTEDNGSSPITVTGWTNGDIVNLYKLGTDDDVYTKVEFTCTNAGTGTFTGTLPLGVSLEDLRYAVYNATLDHYEYSATPENCYFSILPNVKASKNVKDVVVMAAVNSGSGFKMKVVNNIVKVRNTTLNDIEAAWKIRKMFGMSPEHYYVKDMACKINVASGAVSYHQLPTCDITTANFDICKFTLKSKTDYYLSLCPGGSASYQVGLSANGDSAGGFSLIANKLIAFLSFTGGKIYAAPDILPKGALRGLFSVSYLPQKRVHFAKGNLYYTGSAWAMEANQYEYRTWPGKNGTPADNVGLFYWTSATAKSYLETYSETGTGPSDTFFANTDNSVIGSIWNVLTKDEWNYLLNSRTDAASKIGFATVSGVPGAILLPDTFTDPMKNGGSGAFVPKSTIGFSANTYSEGDWNAMESAGAVFLPATGFRSGETLNLVGLQAYYWSATAYDNQHAYSLWISGNSVEINDEIDERRGGYPIRLVTTAE